MTKQKISLDLDDDLYYKLKLYALHNRTTMSSLLREIISYSVRADNDNGINKT